MRILEAQEIRTILTPAACIEAVREALLNIENATATQYLRTVVPMRENKILAFMPTYYSDRYFGAKIISVFPGNSGTAYPSHNGNVMLFGSEHGELLAMLDGTEITEIRTGAASALATDVLSKKDAHSLAILGAGAQARSHYAAIQCIRDIQEVYIYNRTLARAEALKAELIIEASRTGKPCPEITICKTPNEATRNADIVCTLTGSSTPIIDLEDIKPGTHINAVGACAAKDRELASALVAAAKFYGDSRESVFNESGDLLFPIIEGLVTSEHYQGDLGHIIAAKTSGRTNNNDITIFESLGLAAEDIAAAIYCYEQVAPEARHTQESIAVHKLESTEACEPEFTEAHQDKIFDEPITNLSAEIDEGDKTDFGRSETPVNEELEEIVEALKKVSMEITDLNIENGLLQNKLWGKKQAKAQIELNNVRLEELTAEMDALKERKEELEMSSRRRQGLYDILKIDM